MSNNQYTPHDDVNAILDLLLAGVKEILKEQFVGMYLYGSLANGGFDRYSDIDVLFVTRDEILETVFSALQGMHEHIAAIDSLWAIQLEVSYIPKKALRRFDPANNTHPHLDRGNGEKLHLMLHADDWIIQRHALYERGIILEGPDPRTLIEQPSTNEVKWAVIDVLPLWAAPLLQNPAQEIKPRGYQSFIVLSLCRMLYTLKHGAIVSKIVAAEWALKALNDKWSSLIERAIIGRQNAGLEAETEDVNKTLDFIHYTMDQCKQFEKSNSRPKS